MPTRKLTELCPGQKAVVHTMPSQPNIALRLAEIGLSTGTIIQCKGVKQLYQIYGGTFMLNKHVTEQILVDNTKALSAADLRVS